MSSIIGYPSGSINAPQGRLAGGGAIVPYMGQSSRSPSAASTNLDGAGQAQLWDTVMQTMANIPGQLEALQGRINTGVQNIPAGAKTAASRTARYAPGAAVALGQFGQGNILEGLGAGAGTAVAGKLLQGVGRGHPLLGGALMVGGSLLGGGIGSAVGHAVSGIGGQLAGGLGQLMGGAQATAQNVANTVGGVQREAGTSAGSGKEVGLGGMSDQEFNRLKALEQMGINTKLSYAQSMMPLINQQKQNDFVRFMQANQQQGQITGALNRQARAYDLASQSSAENTAITQQMLASNPYAQVAGNFASARA